MAVVVLIRGTKNADYKSNLAGYFEYSFMESSAYIYYIFRKPLLALIYKKDQDVKKK